MLVPNVLLPTPPLGLPTTITGMDDSSRRHARAALGYGSAPAAATFGRAPASTHSDSMADILVLAAHPQLEHSRVTRTLMQAAARAHREGGPHIEVRDLYALYPDYFIDTAAEQAALVPARLVVWLHPVHWYSMPPLMKLWLDEVFAFGWAYGPDGDNPPNAAQTIFRRIGAVMAPDDAPPQPPAA